eukprot:3188358-Pleurochrysis_carterae.AAC.1
MRVALQSPTASLENMDLSDLVKATSSGAITVDDAERELLRRMACADDALAISKLIAMHGVIKVQAEEGRGGHAGRNLVSPSTGLTIGGLMYCFAKALSVVKSGRAPVAVVGTFDEGGGDSSDK